MTGKRLLLTTVASREEANALATELVSRRLAACVNIVGPISSVFRWKDAVERGEEFLLLIKSTAAQTKAIETAVRELHSYELPELIAFNIEDGLAAYLNWIAESVGP